MATTNSKTRRTILDDSLEIVKETGRHLNYGFNPFAASPFEQKENLPQNPDQQQELQKHMREQQQKGPNNTPLDFDKLGDTYKQQDEALHKRLFNQFKQQEERLLEENKQKKAEEERQLAMEEEEKKKREAEENQVIEMPTSVKKRPNRKKADPMEDIGRSGKH